MVSRDPDDLLALDLAQFFADPLGYVMYIFPWETDSTIQVVQLAEGVAELLSEDDRQRQSAYRERFRCEFGPDLWQCDFLEELGAEIRNRSFNGLDPVKPIRFATVSGHEIGKSVLVAWLIKFICDTRPMSKGTVTAVTDEQLRTKTWAELGKWHLVSLTKHWFNYTTGRGAMTLAHKNPKWTGNWRCDAKTSRKGKSESFAGQHSPSATSFYIFDEASGIEEEEVFVVREGGLTSGEPMVFDFGNGTRNSGGFYENCEGKNRSRYIVRSIDSRTVRLTNKAKIAEDAEFWGEDSDPFRVRWRGLFPAKGTMQFISSDDVVAAMERPPPDAYHSARVMGVDCARQGNDLSVIWSRKGSDAKSFPPKAFAGLKQTQLAAYVIEEFKFFEQLGERPAMIFVDIGMGAGVVDILTDLGYPVMEVDFGRRPTKSRIYRLKMDEMWGDMRDGIMKGLALPDRDSEYGDQIYDDLTQREAGDNLKEQICLEAKKEMKKRGLKSPDFADALALTYAMEVAAPPSQLERANATQTNHDYDPLVVGLGLKAYSSADYDPMAMGSR